MWVDPHLLLAYLPVALALVLTPGADMMFALAQGVRGGPRSGVAAAAGIASGAMINVTLAGLGLGALVRAAPWAFDAIRWLGVGYLLWLAIQSLRRPVSPGDAKVRAARPIRAFRDGVIVNVSNPAVILFILALLPQFVDPSRPVLPQFLILGGVLALGGFAVKAVIGATAGGIGRAVAASADFDRALRYVTAGIFGALALRLAAQSRA